MPGDPQLVVRLQTGLTVSIHARHECRAILAVDALRTLIQAVSIHARHECRAIPVRRSCEASDLAVSIHARHECRAIRPTRMAGRLGTMFQSTPGMNAGRSGVRRYHCCTRGEFQSTPGMNAGRSLGSPGRRRPVGLVSIHARHECRAIHSQTLFCLQPLQFQSTPGMNAGRSACWHYR